MVHAFDMYPSPSQRKSIPAASRHSEEDKQKGGEDSREEKEGGAAARRDRVNDSEEEEEKKAAENGGEDTEMSEKSFGKVLLAFSDERSQKKTADDNSGQLMDTPPICCLDRTEIYQENVKIHRT